MKTGYIKKPSAWLYGDNQTEPTDELLMGWAVGILEEKEEWLKVVTHYGYLGYLKRDALCPCSLDELMARENGGRTFFLTRNFIDVMERPDVRSRVLSTLYKGAFFTALPEMKSGYIKVRLVDGQNGYVPWIACEPRKESDGYFYDPFPETYFLRQMEKVCGQEQFRQKLLSNAIRYLGTQYRWAGKSPAGIDCSGFTFMCYLMSGVLIYRDASIKPGYPVHEIGVGLAKPGDLLYFPGHIAMYLGDGRYIHATGNEKSFGCVRNSLLKKDPDYRKDLADSLLMAGSIWE